MVDGTATVGLRNGESFAHLHLRWRDQQEVLLGGHLWPETVVGSPAVVVEVVGLYDAEWASVEDPETLMPTFRPYPLGPTRQMATSEGTISAVVARVLPGEDITEAAIEIAREAGFAKAAVAVGTGSLIGGYYKDPSSGIITIVQGPATEVFNLAGEIDTQLGAESNLLTCSMVDRHGEVHHGTLVPEQNPVAVTFELTITEL
ncbi:hypothetical protein GCM10009720_14340 [Yaniella flava]|uniref:PPC domain-containing protein n=2 Tax=Yaniella flava TaxID=287930 RepID=A0ABN2UFV7_9MICC